MKIAIKNFQSIEDLTLEIKEGAYTCIVGQSNIGKSAIRRAIECVLYNKSDSSYIRTGTKQCSVEITFDNGSILKWQRDDKSSSYEVNGECFSKLSKSVPQPIIDMGFRELEINKEKLNVQVASQFDNIFLLNMTGSKVTDVFSNLGNLNKIINANKACTSDLKNNKGRLSLRKEDLISIKSKIKNYAGLDEQRNSFDNLKESFEEIKAIRNKKDKLFILSKKLEKSSTMLTAARPANQINLEDPNLDLSKFSQLKKLLEKQETLQKKVSSSSELENIKEVTSDIEIGSMKSLSLINLRYEKSCRINQSYSELSSVKEVSLDGDSLYKVKPLKDLLTKLEKSKTSLLNTREKIKQTEEKQTILLDNEKEIHKEIKICPLCNNEFKNV